MRYSAYPKYKESGVNWFDQVPEHWQTKRISYIALLKSGDSIVSEQIREDGDYPVYGGNGLRGYFEDYNHDGNYALIGRQGALCGNINYGQGKFWASEHAVVVYPSKKVSYKWLGETLRAMNLNQYSVSAAQPGLSVSNITPLKIPFPPYEEQTQIAAFLDRETAKIDQLIAKQETLIRLLQEKRTAVISHAVTKGLNPHAPLKDSGIEWLGQIPAHWGIVQSRRLFSLRKSRALPSDKQLTAAQKYGVIYQDDFTKLEGRKVVQVIKGGDILKHVEPYDFVISMRSFQGGIEGSRNRGSISSAYIILIPDESIDFDFYTYLFKSKQYIQALQSTTNLVRDGQALRYSNFTLIDLPIIPKDEQKQIAEFLDNEILKIETLEEKANQMIELLKERRTALISATVTGKIDVRHAIPQGTTQ